MRRQEGTICAILAATTVAVCVCAPSHAALIVPEYSSRPGALTKVFLDFDGDFTETFGTHTPGQTPGYSTDADLDNFSGIELENIRQVWVSVAEKYSPFNINVTTVDPGNRDNYETMAIVIGGDGAWLGEEAGGVAALTAYMNPGANFPNVAFVFPGQLANGYPKFVAEAAAHEAGHAFGLKHQSAYDAAGAKVAEYNPGDALTAPLMGISYASQRALWWRGSNTDGLTNIQDDLSSLSRFGTQQPNFGYRADDHGSTLAAANPLALDGDFDIVPNVPNSRGIVERVTDVDYFSFTTPGGVAFLVADVAEFGAMLDLSMTLYDAGGVPIASAATPSLGETIKLALEPGTYRLGITSAGNYGDIGQYFLSGTVVPEPSSAAVVCLTVAGLLRRRRAR